MVKKVLEGNAYLMDFGGAKMLEGTVSCFGINRGEKRNRRGEKSNWFFANQEALSPKPHLKLRFNFRNILPFTHLIESLPSEMEKRSKIDAVVFKNQRNFRIYVSKG